MAFKVMLWTSWNIALAIVPVVLAFVIQRIYFRANGRPSLLQKVELTATGLAWFLFVPNTCYLLTEWRHIKLGGISAPLNVFHLGFGQAFRLGTYAFLFAILSVLGVISFVVAVYPIVGIAKRKGAKLWAWGIPFFLLNSMAVYLGLSLRFNSWNALNELDSVLQAIIEIFHRPMLLSCIVAFAGFLWLIYNAADRWMSGHPRFNKLMQATPESE